MMTNCLPPAFLCMLDVLQYPVPTNTATNDTLCFCVGLFRHAEKIRRLGELRMRLNEICCFLGVGGIALTAITAEVCRYGLIRGYLVYMSQDPLLQEVQ